MIDVPIRDENDRPLWLIHFAQEMRAIDVVALPLDYESLKTKVTLLPVNELAPGKIAIMIGMDVFILGYPFGAKPPRSLSGNGVASRPNRIWYACPPGTTSGYRLTSRHVGLAGHIRQWLKPHP